MKTRCLTRDKTRDKSLSCLAVSPFPFLREGQTRQGRDKVSGAGLTFSSSACNRDGQCAPERRELSKCDPTTASLGTRASEPRALLRRPSRGRGGIESRICAKGGNRAHPFARNLAIPKFRGDEMGRPRKPTELHIVDGTHRKDRHGPLPSPLARVEPLGPPPSDWEPAGKALWHELATQIPLGVATKGDRLSFETLCRLVMRMRADKTPTPALAAQIRAYAALFGLSPSARASLAPPPPADDDDPLRKYTTPSPRPK